MPDGYDGWFRLDCGYEHKPDGEPDLSNVTRLNVIAVGPDDGPTRMLVEDLRRTEAIDNGKAILAFYDGYRSHYDIAAERLEERGWAGAVPVDPRQVGGGNRMGFDELRERGWDVCSYPRKAPSPSSPRIASGRSSRDSVTPSRTTASRMGRVSSSPRSGDG